MAEERRDVFPTSGGQSGRESRGAQPHDGEDRDDGPEAGWNRRRRYGAFYASAAERARLRQRPFEGRGARGESERGWNIGAASGRTHGGSGYAPMGEGEGGDYPAYTPRPSGSHTPRFGGYRGWGREGREAGEYGRGEERYGNERYGGEGAAGEREWNDRYRGDFEERTERGREWGGGEGVARRYSATMGGGRDIGHEQLYDRRARSGYESRWQRESLTAREVMTADVKSVSPESSLADVARIMKDENCGIVPVIDDDRRLRGVVTDRDIVLRTLAEGKNPNDVRVGELMTDDVNGVTPEETVCEVIELMGSKQVRRVPVVDRDDRLLGIISLADVANRADYDEDLQEALEKISTRRSFWSRLWS